VPTLPGATELREATPPPWLGGLESTVFGPVRGIAEVVFVHPESRMLILDRPGVEPARLRAPASSALDCACGVGFGPSRNARLLRADPPEARHVLRRILEWRFERILVAHGSG
jgi:hypothetical protein